MVILRGDAATFAEAKRLIEAIPNPDHIAEYEAVAGEKKGILAMLDDSLAASCVVGCAVKDGEALVGGVMLYGFINYQIWLLTTKDAGRFPRWMLREGRTFLKAADRFIGMGCSFYQFIPTSYRGGISFVEHLGFSKTRTVRGDDGQAPLAVMERAIPKEGARGRTE